MYFEWLRDLFKVHIFIKDKHKYERTHTHMHTLSRIKHVHARACTHGDIRILIWSFVPSSHPPFLLIFIYLSPLYENNNSFWSSFAVFSLFLSSPVIQSVVHLFYVQMIMFIVTVSIFCDVIPGGRKFLRYESKVSSLI